jgi:hypothetical protein
MWNSSHPYPFLIVHSLSSRDFWKHVDQLFHNRWRSVLRTECQFDRSLIIALMVPSPVEDYLPAWFIVVVYEMSVIFMYYIFSLCLTTRAEEVRNGHPTTFPSVDQLNQRQLIAPQRNENSSTTVSLSPTLASQSVSSPLGHSPSVARCLPPLSKQVIGQQKHRERERATISSSAAPPPDNDVSRRVLGQHRRCERERAARTSLQSPPAQPSPRPPLPLCILSKRHLAQ